MDLLLTFGLPVLLFLALEIFWCWPARRDPGVGWRERIDRPEALTPAPDPHAWSQVRQRLEVLAAELERLDDDSEIFAKAFRTHVAEAAYKSLMADAVRLADASRLAGLSRPADGTVVEVEIPNSQAPLREVLEV